MAKGIEVFFATNRNIEREKDDPAFGNAFNSRGPHHLRFGSAIASKTKKGEYKVEKITLAPESLEAKDEADQVLGSKAIFAALHKRMQSDKIDVICLIHGFASDIKTSLERGVELKDKYRVAGREPHVFVFSWPSDGATTPPVRYFSDRDDARASGVAIARAFLKLRDFLTDLGKARHCEQSIHLVAHSMGNYALRHALQGIRGELGDQLPRLLDNVFLMCADEDDDAFEYDHKFRLLPRLAKAVHVYFAENDRALVVSDVTKRNPDRLGSQGPRLRDSLPRRINLIDCTDVSDAAGDLSQHQYYRLRPEVVDDVNEVLKGVAPGDCSQRSYIPDDRSYRLAPKSKTRKASSRPARTGGRNR